MPLIEEKDRKTIQDTLAIKYTVHGVPKTVINEDISVEGAVPEYRLIDEVIKALEPKQWSH
ncbi:MAG: thioredoxin family protein [Candidatus Zixiibacteriota bacterium]|nr:MAG: thioredoxin family protein [candidate division Zixibacteria bacterium]